MLRIMKYFALGTIKLLIQNDKVSFYHLFIHNDNKLIVSLLEAVRRSSIVIPAIPNSC